MKHAFPLFRLTRVGQALFLTCMLFLQHDLAQAQTETGSSAPAPRVEQIEGRTVIGLIKQGGFIMYPLGIISIWCVSLIIEGFIRIRLPKFAPGDVVRKLRAAFAEENYQQAWRLCKAHPSFLTNILRRGLERIGRGRNACETALSDHSLKESMVFRTKISYLSTIGVVSPMVGLLGTVWGMIQAFQTLGSGGIGDPTKLAAAIGEVLISTASGLGIAIPAFFLYYFLRNRLQLVIVLSEDIINQLMVDVNYEELQGINIGETLESELAGGAAAPATPQKESGLIERRTSQAITGVTTVCPQCQHPLATGTPKCGKCGAELQWS